MPNVQPTDMSHVTVSAFSACVSMKETVSWSAHTFCGETPRTSPTEISRHFSPSAAQIASSEAGPRPLVISHAYFSMARSSFGTHTSAWMKENSGWPFHFETPQDPSSSSTSPGFGRCESFPLHVPASVLKMWNAAAPPRSSSTFG